MKKQFRKLFDIGIVLLHVAVGGYIIWARPLDHGSWWGNVVTALMIIGIGATAFDSHSFATRLQSCTKS